jgi:predicted exporter
VRWLVPSLMPARIPIPAGLLRAFARVPAAPRHMGWIPPLLGIAAVVWLWHTPTPLWNDDIEAMNPISETSKQLDESLRRELGAPDLRKLLVVRGASDEDVLVESERLAKRLDPLVSDGALQGYDAAARHLPSRREQGERQRMIPSTEVLRERLSNAQQGLAFRRGTFEPFVADATSAREQALLSLSDPLPEVLASRVKSLLFRLDGHWVGLVPLRGVSDEDRLHQALADLDPERASYLDLGDETSHMLGQYRREALQLLGWSTLAIVVLLAAGLGSVTTTLRVLLPMACAAAVTAAIMAEAASGLSLFHLVSLLLVMGLSLDQALFFNRASEDHEERARTLLSLALCNASAVVAFGILATSSVNLLRDIGATVALGAVLALVFAAMLARGTVANARNEP